MTKANRLNRRSYFVSLLLAYTTLGAGYLMDVLLYTATGTEFESNKFGMPFLLISLFIGTIYSAMSGIRRLHDIDESGWYLLLAVIPLAGLVIALPMLFKKGTDGGNKYGKPMNDLIALGIK